MCTIGAMTPNLLRWSFGSARTTHTVCVKGVGGGGRGRGEGGGYRIWPMNAYFRSSNHLIIIKCNNNVFLVIIARYLHRMRLCCKSPLSIIHYHTCMSVYVCVCVYVCGDV